MQKMGVSCIQLWEQPDTSVDPSAAFTGLQRRVEKLGAKSLGSWMIECETYQSAQGVANPPKVMHLLHTSEYPRSSFAITEKAAAAGATSLTLGTCLVADQQLDLIMQNLKGFYAPRKGYKMEAKGVRYENNHFVIKMASIVYGASSRGILVEVEETRSCVVAECWDSLAQFVQALLQQAQPQSPPPKSPSEPEYTPVDRVLQYVQIFAKLRKGTK